MAVALKSTREKASLNDGVRVLVDAAWPAGISKQRLRIDHWMRPLAPSPALRRWYRGRPEFLPAFRKRYLQELAEPARSAAFEMLQELAHSSRKLTIVYSARAEQPAHVLRDLLEGMRKPPSSSGPARAAAAGGRQRMSRPR